MPEQSNILLIVVDQWRADCLGAAGHPVVQTPHLDQLAGQGTRFSRAYAAVPSCIAARASLMTGLHQRNHGRVGYRDNVPWNYPVTLGSVFSGAGYHTQVVGKMHVAPARSLLGFHNILLHDGYLHWNRLRQPDLTADDDYLMDLRRQHGPAVDYIDSGIGCNGYVVSPWPYDPMLHPSAWVTTQSIDFLRRRDPTRPFLLVASYHRPHPPLDPPPAYLDLYRDLPLPPLPYGDWVGGDGLPDGSTRPGALDSPTQLSPAQQDRARRAYYAQMTFIDHQINRLTMALWEHRVLNDTAIVFVGDHGDMMFDHGLFAKSLPYQGSAGVPLIILPALNGGFGSVGEVDAPVELRDLLPTLCDLGGVPIPAGLDGHSLCPFLNGGTAPGWRPWLHGEHESGPWSNQWLTDGHTKYIWYSQSGQEQLFNLDTDPGECHDLAPHRSAEMLVWRERLVQELDGREEGYVQEGCLMVGMPPGSTLQSAGLP